MKIENYSGNADTFIFPNPANSFDDQGESNSQVTMVPFSGLHIQVGAGGIKPKSLVLQGHFFGTDRATNYRELSKHFTFEDQKLKKLYFEDNKFYLGYGISCRKTNSGEKVGFIDYVANFRQICPIIFSDTQKIANSSTTQTNQGNIYTYVEEITGEVTAGSSDITIVDNTGLNLTVPSDKIATGDTISIKFISMVDAGAGAKYSYYNYLKINGSQANGLKSSGLGSLKIEVGGSVGPSGDITISNLSSWEIKFRDGWTA